MTKLKLKTQEMVKLEISTNYNAHVTVQIWRETMEQTRNLCKFFFFLKKISLKINILY